jgi:hypothetical protein
MAGKRGYIRFLLTAILIVCLLAIRTDSSAQCSICTRTAEQMGEKPAKGMNAGIIYLAFAPLGLIGFIGYRWLRNNRLHATKDNS